MFTDKDKETKYVTPVRNDPKFGPIGLLWKPVEERLLFPHGDNDDQAQFIDYWPTNKNKKPIHCIRICEVHTSGLGNSNDYAIHGVEDFSMEELKSFGVWDLLSEGMQKVIEKQSKIDEEIVSSRMEHARKHRKNNPEYDGVPRELKCCTKGCGNVVKYSPAIIIKQAEIRNISVAEYVSTWKCSECEPRKRGKKTSAKYANMPKELHCSEKGCKVVQVQHPSITEKQAAASGKTFTEFVNEWKCREHRAKKAHPLSAEGRALRGDKGGHRGRPANPLYANIPKKAICIGCGEEVTLMPQNVLDKCKVLGKTVEELVGSYKCRKCGGRLKKSDIAAMKKRERAEKKKKGKAVEA